MVRAIKQIVTVQPGHRVELTASELVPGERVEVIVLLVPGPRRKSYQALLGSGRGAYATPDEADEFLRRLRDEWDR
jgi:hypothetical protein